MQIGLSEQSSIENFTGRTYTLRGLIAMLARRGWRGALALKWPEITKLHFAEYEPENAVEFSLWHSEVGKMITLQPKPTQSWRELLEQSKIIDSDITIPRILKTDKSLALLFAIVFPHRLTTDFIKFLDIELHSYYDENMNLTA